MPGTGELTSWEVGQECICECNGTSTGIFCRGANAAHDFVAVASTEVDDSKWYMEQRSRTGSGPGASKTPWRSFARFGNSCV